MVMPTRLIRLELLFQCLSGMDQFKFLLNSFFDETVKTLLMHHSIDSSPPVNVAVFKSYILSAFVSSLRGSVFFFAKSQIVVYCSMKIGNKFVGVGPFV